MSIGLIAVLAECFA